MYKQVIDTVQAAIERIVAEDLPVPEKLRRIIRHQVHYLVAHIPLTQVFFSEIFSLPPLLSTIAPARKSLRLTVCGSLCIDL